MPLGKDYPSQHCSLSTVLEIVGERWTLLIVHDAFLGVRRFGDFAAHLGVPRAVLSDRLKSLIASGVMHQAQGLRGDYELTERGIALWPAITALTAWGDHFFSPRGPEAVLTHVSDGGVVGPGGQCASCEALVAPIDLVRSPGPGAVEAGADSDPVTRALAEPHRLLVPLLP